MLTGKNRDPLKFIFRTSINIVQRIKGEKGIFMQNVRIIQGDGAEFIYEVLRENFSTVEILRYGTPEEFIEQGEYDNQPIFYILPSDVDLPSALRNIQIIRYHFRAPLIICAEGELSIEKKKRFLEYGADAVVGEDEKVLLIHHIRTFLRLTEPSLDYTGSRRQSDKTNGIDEKYFRLFFEHIPDYALLIDPTHKGGATIIDASENAWKIHGYTREEFIGLKVEVLEVPNSRAKNSEIFRQLSEKGAITFVTRHKRKDGTVFPVEVYAEIIYLDNRPIIFSVERDLSETVATQRALDESKMRLRSIIELAPDAILLVDGKGKIISWNKSAERIFGYRSSEIVGRSYLNLLPPEEKQKQARLLEEIFFVRNTKVYKPPVELPAYTKSGNLVPVELAISSWDINGSRYYTVIIRDIRERKIVERALRESEERFRLIVENSHAGIILVDDRYRFVYVNKQFCEITGYEPEELLHQDFRKIIAPDSLPLVTDRYRRRQRGEKVPGVYEFDILRKDGQIRTVEVRSAIIRTSSGKVQTVSQVLDITDRKRAGEQLVRLATVIEQASEAVVITDIFGNIEYVNPAFEKMTGYRFEEVIGKTPRILKSGKHEDKFYQELWDTITAGRVWRGTFINKKKDGTLYYDEAVIFPITDDSGTIINFAAVKHDITSQRELEEQFRQAQKMDAIGKLAGGVAHDFNNLLTVINGYADLLLAFMEPGNPYYSEIQEIKKAGERAASLTGQLLAFSRKQVVRPRIININQLVKDAEKMLKRIIGEHIQLVTRLDPDVLNIKIDPGQLDQVIMNLVVNARDAMPTGGTLTIETGNVALDQSYVKSHLGTTPGQYVRLVVSDTGIGMDEETKSHIFEPFFTTKGREKGTGLGLSTVYGIVKQNNGYIQVESAPGEGTTFQIYFPAVTEEENEKVDQFKRVYPGKNETILLVEDEKEVRALARKILIGNGYRVLLAKDGNTALQIAQRYPGRIHLVLTDVIMPGMNGRDVAREIQKMRPEVKVIYMSGYTYDAILPHGILEDSTRFIQKPFNTLELLQTIREALDEAVRMPDSQSDN